MLGSPFAAMGLANLAQQFGSGGELNHCLVNCHYHLLVQQNTCLLFMYSGVLPMMVFALFSGSASCSRAGGHWRLSGPFWKPRFNSGICICIALVSYSG